MVGSEFLLVGVLSANHYRLMKLVKAERAGVRAKERRSKQFVPNELQADPLLITPTIGPRKSLLNPSGLCFNGHNAASVKRKSLSARCCGSLALSAREVIPLESQKIELKSTI